eukprot:scaffold42025_cov150-Skeletonema_dohrnii-CCMP3373.AAC.2
MMTMNSSVGGYSQYHESRIGGEIVGNLTRGCIISRLEVMRSQEQSTYSYRNYEPPAFPHPTNRNNADESIPHLNSSWREKICHWSFNVIDHFDLSREVVAVSMSLFDRFLATRGNRCNGSTALLASLTTLHIAIKVNEVRKIKLGTLANLSRGQFGPRHIEEMEWNVLTSLEWKIHPPTSMSFISHLLLLLPPQVDDACKEEIYALSRYITELSVCDSSFVEINPSSVAFAAILNSLEDRKYRKFISSSVRDQFVRSIERHVDIRQDDEHVAMARPKLKKLLKNSFAQDAASSSQGGSSSQTPQQQQLNVAQSVSSVTGSINGMQIQENKMDDSSMSSKLSRLSGRSRHSRSSSLDSNISVNRRRVVPVGGGSSINANAMAQASPSFRSRPPPSPSNRSMSSTVMSTSPCSLSSRSSRSVFSRGSRVSPLALLGS